MNKLKLLAFYVIASAVFFSGCKDDNYVGIVGVCPQVISTIPLDKAVKVPFNQVISATFNEEMNPATINQSSCVLQGITSSMDGLNTEMEPTIIAGTITYSGKTLTFTPSDLLLVNTAYTFTVKTSVKDLMGNALQQNYEWTFSTTTSPSVISVSPANEAADIDLDESITATFSVPMDAVSISALTYTVSQGTTPVEGTVSLNENIATFTPTNDLLPNTTYTGTITTGAKNVDGIPLLSNYVWTFNTRLSPSVISTSPANDASDIHLDEIITATFSVPMDAGSISALTYTVSQGTLPVDGTVSFNGSIASFTPTNDLLPNTTYTGTITTGAKDVDGVLLLSNYVWTFTTSLNPTVDVVFPLNNSVDIPLDASITASFSMPMDPTTLTGATVTLQHGTETVAGEVSYSGSTVTFNPTSNLLLNTVYTVTITTETKSEAGTSLENNYVWTFTTIVAPTVISTFPENNATGVSLDVIVTATFSVPMDPQTFSTTTFTLKQGTSITGVVIYSGSMVSFDAPNYLLPNTVYTATITNEVKNEFGTSMENSYVWSFTTGAGLVVSP